MNVQTALFFSSLQKGNTLITKGSRLARHWRQHYDRRQGEQGKQLWPSADILPFDAWVKRGRQDCLYYGNGDGCLLLSPAQEKIVWEQVIASSESGSELLNVRATAALASEAWTLLHEWELPCAAAAFSEAPDTKAFWGWMQNFRMLLNKNCWITRVQAVAHLIMSIERHQLMLPEQIYYAGLNQFTPQENRLFAAIREAGTTLTAIAGEPIVHSEPVRVALSNGEEEILAAAHWARRRVESGVLPIGIIVPDLASCHATVERIFRDVFEPGTDYPSPRSFHLSTGASLAETPLIMGALQLLQLGNQSSVQEAGMLLRSPFFGLNRSAAAQIDKELRRSGLTEVNFHSMPGEGPWRTLRDQHGTFQGRRLASQWISALTSLLQAGGWPGKRTLSSVEYQIVERWQDLLGEFAQLDTVLKPLSYREAVDQLRSLASQTSWVPADEESPVQIMG